MSKSPIIALGSLAALLVLAVFPAASAEFLPVGKAVDALVKGRTWSVMTSEGRAARLTFQPDGTGSFRGPMTLAFQWEAKGEEVCLHLFVSGTKCLRFRPTAAGLEGWQQGKVDLTLSR